ncbi:uncharacterized protein LOC119829368 [Zerene cesonia]|uniref:uncharacterized protein LOC119829368 n=1 Tax=Zerene cesonia TaxID=33412 RepID=UPI0018E57E5D|nr:uncharacterized protein LOC119829368 [Zerene cesonia]
MSNEMDKGEDLTEKSMEKIYLVALEEEQPEKIVKRDEDAPKKRIITEFGLVVPSENDFTLSESSRSKQQFIYKAKEKKGKSYDKSKNTYKEKNEKEIQKKLDRPHSQTNEASKEKGKKEQTQITDKEVESQSETPAKGDVGSETPDYTKDADQNQENKSKGVGLAIIKAKEKEMRSRMKNKQKEKSKNDGQVQPTTTELTISKVKLRKPSTDDLVLQLVKIKHSEGGHRVRPKRWSELNISPLIIKRHQGHKLHQCMPGTRCLFCEDSELELDIDNILYNEEKQEELDEDAHEPFLFNTKYEPIHEDMKEEFKSPQPPKKQPETEVTKGVTRYALSDRSFIDKGWTLLPTEKIVRQMNVYRMRPANPEFNWFENNKNKKMSYDTGEKLAEIDDNGKGHWFYRNGCKALDYYDAEEIHVQQRYVIYSNGEPDDRGRSRPLTILAMFDYLGNGIVFDHKGKIRLKYNQTEGVVLDRNIGPVSHWKWHTLNDPPVLQQILIDTHLTHKDPDILKFSGPGDDITRHENEDMIAIEFDNFIKEKSKKLSQNFEPFQIKMKALKINENFSLRVLGQDKIYLIFRDGSTNLKLNIGMVLDHKEIVDTDIAEVGEVSNSLKRYPAPSSSIAALQENIEQTKCIQRARFERERRIRPKQIYSSADKLISGISKPLQKPILPAPSRATTNSTEYQCRCRKPSLKNLYYDTRLI